MFALTLVKRLCSGSSNSFILISNAALDSLAGRL